MEKTKGDAGKQRQYGLGFYLEWSMENNLHGFKLISNRIAILRLCAPPQIEKNKRNSTSGKVTTICIINVYAPTAKSGQEEELEQFYDLLRTPLIDQRPHNAFVFLASDWNVYFGQLPSDGEDTRPIIGPYGYGFKTPAIHATGTGKDRFTRSFHGNMMRDFLKHRQLYVAKTTS